VARRRMAPEGLCRANGQWKSGGSRGAKGKPSTRGVEDGMRLHSPLAQEDADETRYARPGLGSDRAFDDVGGECYSKVVNCAAYRSRSLGTENRDDAKDRRREAKAAGEESRARALASRRWQVV
jgi:hypothetical protein